MAFLIKGIVGEATKAIKAVGEVVKEVKKKDGMSDGIRETYTYRIYRNECPVCSVADSIYVLRESRFLVCLDCFTLFYILKRSEDPRVLKIAIYQPDVLFTSLSQATLPYSPTEELIAVSTQRNGHTYGNIDEEIAAIKASHQKRK